MALPMMLTPGYLPTIEALSGEELQARKKQLNVESAQGLKNEAGPLAAPQIGKGAGVYSIGNRTQPLPTLAPDARTLTNPSPPEEAGIPARGTMSVVPPEYFTGGPSPAMSRELSAARFAAADRGDWNAVNTSYGESKPAQETAPYFPSTIKGLVARAMYERGQSENRANAGLRIRQQEAETQAQNVHSESALRTMQGRGLGASHLAEIQKARLTDEYLNPNTDPARAERVAHLLGIVKPEDTIPEKDITGLFTGRVLNKSTGEIRGGPAGPEPLPNHVAALKAGKVTPAQFDEKYGVGASKRYQGS